MASRQVAIWQRPGIIVLTVAVLYLLFLINNDLLRVRDMMWQKVLLENKMKEQRVLNAELLEKEKMLSNLHYIEEVARDRLAFVKRGETVYKIIEVD